MKVNFRQQCRLFGVWQLGAALSVSVLGAAPGYARTCTGFDAGYSRYADSGAAGSASFDRCVDDSGGVTAAMRDCLRIETGRLDRALPMALEKAATRVGKQCGANAANALRRSQGHWRTIRDRHCMEEMKSGGGGTAGLLIGDSCVMRERQRRIRWLDQL